MKIAFHSNQLSLRGTEVALYDYAKYNEEILGNESIILSKISGINPFVLKKFSNRFNVKLYTDVSGIERILDNNNVDIFYAIKAGFNDGIVSNSRKSVNHVVFQHYDPHGSVYAYVSEWLGRKYNSPYVPHIVSLPDINDDLREEFNIPKEAIVFGRYGGAETFDVDYAREAVKYVAEKRPDIYFLFLFTNRFSEESQKNIIYLDGTEDLYAKTKFINTCDAMLHARMAGESFGLSVGEFSIKNKPVITNLHCRDGAHIEMLGKKGIYYTSYSELVTILNNFKPEPDKDWNAYRAYNPENVMKKFKEIFL